VVKRCAVLVVLSGCAVAVASCGTIAGLGDYELASQDAAVGDATGEGPFLGDVVQTDGSDGGADAAEANAGDDGDAGALADSTGDSAVGPEADAPADGPTVPPTDKSHVPCGSDTCNVPAEECCEEPDASTCQQTGGGNCSGVVAICDEAANCQPGDVCCVTGQTATALETQCKQSCSGGDPQSCRTSGECGGVGPCVAWTCAGSVVATCGGAGSASGCH
jgi:hypothetical protein